MNHTPLFLALPVALCAIVSAGGCAFDGNDKFACPGYPGQPLCLPPSAIYRLSEGAGPPPAAMQRPTQQTYSGAGQTARDGALVWSN